jgi:hypothetical protein
MARTKSTPFQLELIRQQNDKSRTKRISTLNQRIVTLADQSKYERKRGIRLAIAAQQARRQQIHLIEDELDDQSSDSEEETDNSGSEEENKHLLPDPQFRLHRWNYPRILARVQREHFTSISSNVGPNLTRKAKQTHRC